MSLPVEGSGYAWPQRPTGNKKQDKSLLVNGRPMSQEAIAEITYSTPEPQQQQRPTGNKKQDRSLLVNGRPMSQEDIAAITYSSPEPQQQQQQAVNKKQDKSLLVNGRPMSQDALAAATYSSAGDKGGVSAAPAASAQSSNESPQSEIKAPKFSWQKGKEKAQAWQAENDKGNEWKNTQQGQKDYSKSYDFSAKRFTGR